MYDIDYAARLIELDSATIPMPEDSSTEDPLATTIANMVLELHGMEQAVTWAVEDMRQACDQIDRALHSGAHHLNGVNEIARQLTEVTARRNITRQHINYLARVWRIQNGQED